MKKEYCVPDMERLTLKFSFDVLTISNSSSNTGENDVPDAGHEQNLDDWP